jgi:transmembrane 9 superfamily protein 2/4
MMENVPCKQLCTPIPKEDAEFMVERVKENYAINWLIDGLPAARKRKDERSEGSEQEFYGIGFELGYMKDTSAHINNHYHIQIMYHTREEDNYRVVGVLVYPQSLNNQLANGQVSCTGGGNGGQEFKFDGKDTITYTYSVAWEVGRC